MGRMSEPDTVTRNFHAACDALIASCREVMAMCESSMGAGKGTPVSMPITLEQVRAVLAEKSRNGHTARVRGLFEKHGAAKLSEIDPKEYPALLAEAEAIDDG